MEYTLENVKCEKCGHSAFQHSEDGCNFNEADTECAYCWRTPSDILLHHLNAVAKERDEALRQADYFSGQLIEGPQYG